MTDLPRLRKKKKGGGHWYEAKHYLVQYSVGVAFHFMRKFVGLIKLEVSEKAQLLRSQFPILKELLDEPLDDREHFCPIGTFRIFKWRNNHVKTKHLTRRRNDEDDSGEPWIWLACSGWGHRILRMQLTIVSESFTF